jgi:tryptophanyl-tRNA synthetase
MKTVPGTDGQKMSKSYGNTIPLFASDEEIKTAVMAIPTDSKSVAEPKNPEGDIVFAFHKLLSSNVDEIESRYREGGMGYKESKEMLIENMIRFIAPLREKRKKFETKETGERDTREGRRYRAHEGGEKDGRSDKKSGTHSIKVHSE